MVNELPSFWIKLLTIGEIDRGGKWLDFLLIPGSCQSIWTESRCCAGISFFKLVRVSCQAMFEDTSGSASITAHVMRGRHSKRRSRCECRGADNTVAVHVGSVVHHEHAPQTGMGLGKNWETSALAHCSACNVVRGLLCCGLATNRSMRMETQNWGSLAGVIKPPGMNFESA
jgi:hypothetical protein